MREIKDRVIIDTNLWIHFLLSKDFSDLDSLIANQKITLLLSQQLLDEFLEVANRPKFEKYYTKTDLETLFNELNRRSEIIDVSTSVSACRDPKDNFLLALAVDGNATHLLTGDKDLLSLKQHGMTKILSLSTYLFEGNSEN